MDNDNNQEITIEQRTQAIIDFNKWLDSLPATLPQLTDEQKQELADSIEKRKKELGLD